MSNYTYEGTFRCPVYTDIDGKKFLHLEDIEGTVVRVRLTRRESGNEDIDDLSNDHYFISLVELPMIKQPVIVAEDVV